MKHLAALNAEVADLVKRIAKLETPEARKLSAELKKITKAIVDHEARLSRMETNSHAIEMWMSAIDAKLGQANAMLFKLDARNEAPSFTPPPPNPTPKG